MNALKQRGRPLTKEEVIYLLKLVEENPVIFSKCANASSNRLKDAAWLKITNNFNATIASYPRKAEQLRLKWENLKKNARRRFFKTKSENGNTEHIHSNNILDKVTSILNAACNGDLQFGDSVDNSAVEEEETEEEAVIVIPYDNEQKRQTLADDVKTSVAEKNRAIAMYYDAKRKNEQEIFKLRKRKLELDLIEKKLSLCLSD